jgi:dihydroxy-acid dehydratase
VSPEAAAGGGIALVEDGDSISIDIPARRIDVEIAQEELAERRAKEEARGSEAFTPAGRSRLVSKALEAYAFLATSADQGAVRRIPH